MKTTKILSAIGLSVLLCAPSLVNAQKDARAPFLKGDNMLGAFIGGGVGYGYGAGASVLPTFGVVYDHGIINNAGPGTIGIGGIIAYKSANASYFGNSKSRWTNIFVGVRATYHLTLLKDKNNKFDPYGGVAAGIRAFKYTDDRAGILNDNYIRPFGGLFVGAKYNFTPNFGAFAELGYDVTFFKAGIHLSF